jgi:twinkle protein
MGKSELWKEVMVHLGEHHKVPVGGLYLEETPEHTVRCLAGKVRDKLFHIPDQQWTQEELMDTVNGMQLSGNYHLYDHFGHTDYDTIKSRIRYMVASLNCRHIFLDHITALVSGDKEGDERKVGVDPFSWMVMDLIPKLPLRFARTRCAGHLIQE